MYTIEYRIGDSGIMMKRGMNLCKMLHDIMTMGCRISPVGIEGALRWSKTATNGKRTYIGCVCTITKGNREMTEYTSF